METTRRIRLRYQGRCILCDTELAPGTPAWWDRSAKNVRCLSCEEPPEAPEGRVEVADDLAAGVAGGSAAREWERRRQRRKERIRSRFPRIGGLILALSGEPQTTRAWEQGAAGERILGDRLDQLGHDGAIVLHDRRSPRSRANIDHLVVAGSGVYVVDAKHYRGRIRTRDVGGLFRSERRLYVGRRDCSKLVAGVERQVGVVVEALGAVGTSAPVHGVLCFVRGDWSLLARPIELDRVTVTWPKDLEKRLRAGGPLGHEQVDELGRVLATTFRPNS